MQNMLTNRIFTINANYTFTDSETQYPITELRNEVPPEGGRPTQIRIDSTITGPMLFQPKHIINASLGFNRKDLNIWLSFQYNGTNFTGYHPYHTEYYNLKEHFYRWDLQITQKFTRWVDGLEVMLNIANLSDFNEQSRHSGYQYPTYGESYGWTVDLGVRYRIK